VQISYVKESNIVKRTLDLKKPPQLSAGQKARLDAVASIGILQAQAVSVPHQCGFALLRLSAQGTLEMTQDSYTVQVEIQSRPPEYGPGRHYPKTATGHGCVTVLLLAALKKGGIAQA